MVESGSIGQMNAIRYAGKRDLRRYGQHLPNFPGCSFWGVNWHLEY